MEEKIEEVCDPSWIQTVGVYCFLTLLSFMAFAGVFTQDDFLGRLPLEVLENKACR
jgi:hypothetical protein